MSSTRWLRVVLLLTGLALSSWRSRVIAQAERCSNPGELRLVNGTNPREGRVEVCVRGEWGTICDDLWDGRDAEVVCRQLGFATSGAIAAAGAYFGPGTGPILLDNVECTGSEERLMACPNQRFGQHSCLHSEDASVICQAVDFTCPTGAVRLAGGREPHEGRVEICVNNQYGTICDDNWDDRDAAVICAQLGFSRTNAVAVTKTQAYGIGIGNIYFDDVSCLGIEHNITECGHAGVGRHNCFHFEDAAVLCRPNTPSKVCEDGQIRLQGGKTADHSDGRVEICFNDRWGTVCDDNFGVEEAGVVCRQLGFPADGAIPVGKAAYRPGMGIIFLDNLACLGNETYLKDCKHGGLGNHNCGHTEDASVICSPAGKEECTNGSVRLVNGTTAYEGRVEVCVNNHWGTICDDQWDTREATVVCRQLGFTNGNAVALPQAIFGSGTGIIWFDDMMCSGSEATLLSCAHRGFGISNCAHSEDANVLCPVPSSETKMCENGKLRLVNGSVANEGRVELCFHNRWGTVCDDNWVASSAQVVCRQLGYPTDGVMGALATTNAFFGQGTGPIFLDKLSCVGNETHLLQCSNAIELGQHNCAHMEDAGVICPVPVEIQSCRDGDVRLMGGGKRGEGFVEICINNRWGTICGNTDAKWDNDEAAVVCRQLGFNLADTRAVAVLGGGFGTGSGPIFLNNMECAGDEENLLQCRHSGVVALQPGCSHAFDAGVVCAVVPCVENDFRLVGGTNTSGRIEVCVDGQWGKICSDSFDDKTAAMVCKQIGLKAGVTMRTGVFGKGSGGMFSVSVSDSGSIVPREEEKCSHDDVAALFCLAEGVDEVCTPGAVRLVKGESPYEGRVEMCLDNQWGTVCDDSWDENSATVVCKQLGFDVGAPAFSFGAGSKYQPILLDDTKCTGAEPSLLQCQSNKQHNCNHDEDAGVICTTRSDAAESDGLTTDQAVAISVPVVVVTILLVTVCAIIIIFFVYTKFRTGPHLDQAPIVEAENGIITENGLHEGDTSSEKQKFEDKL